MLADTTRRGSVLEPEGIVEIKFPINHESSTNIVERISENVFHPQRILSCKPTSQIYSVQLFVNSEEVRFNNSNDTDEPKIHINDPVNVMEGDDIRINCTIRYDIDEDQKEFNCNNDAGEYKCITRGVNSEKSASVHVTIHGVDALNISLTTPKEFYSSKLNNVVILKVNIERIPVIKAMNTSQNYYMINDTAELSCYATGFPIPKFQWIVDGIRTRNYQTSKDNDSLLFEKTEKFIFNVTKMVDVTCKVCITQDDNSCEKKNLQIRMIDVPNGFGTTKYDETIISGDEFGVTCLASLYMYKEVNWYNENGTEVVSDNNIMIQKNTTELSHSSSLSIKSVPNSKRLLYTCKARKVEDNMVEQTNINVTVYDELAPYFIYTNMNKTTVTYDSNTAQLIMLKCYAGGYPVPSVTWLINQKKINSTCNYITFNNTELYIIRLHRNCTGEYKCIVKNRVGEIMNFQNLQLETSYSLGHQPISDNAVFITFIIIVVAVSLMCIIIFIYKLKCKKSSDEEIDSEPVPDRIECLPHDEQWEYSSDNLKFVEELGSGTFGVVYKAEANGIGGDEHTIIVAVKMIKQTSDPSNKEALLSELEIMKDVGKHVNIISLLGACTKNIAKGVLYIIVELCSHGNLHDYLQRNKNNFINQIDNDGNINCSIGRQTSDAIKNE
ncbi:vascular endothelial growth factor receptor 1-like [Aphidius gifuensis]|uniref:vascular endothelial growth factor receptor 1-like n=1 Tax=Aphidius gifuensis TaxID=684658 RepID=UPI001CDC0DFE|nr:vascular endothelial growth factor receptor 1-like [Aphidius gifuensis]